MKELLLVKLPDCLIYIYIPRLISSTVFVSPSACVAVRLLNVGMNCIIYHETPSLPLGSYLPSSSDYDCLRMKVKRLRELLRDSVLTSVSWLSASCCCDDGEKSVGVTTRSVVTVVLAVRTTEEKYVRYYEVKLQTSSLQFWLCKTPRAITRIIVTVVLALLTMQEDQTNYDEIQCVWFFCCSDHAKELNEQQRDQLRLLFSQFWPYKRTEQAIARSVVTAVHAVPSVAMQAQDQPFC